MTKPFNLTPENTYVVAGTDYWIATKAKTLRGAMRIATNTFQVAVGGKITVGITIGREETFRVEEVAVKYGYDNWIQR